MRRLELAPLGLVLALCLPAPPAYAQDGPVPYVAISQDGTLLAAGNAAGDRLAVYRIAGNSVTLLSARNLADDFEQAPRALTGPVTPPAKDNPGQDPPAFRRPPKSVRTASTYSLAGEEWRATYLVPAIPDDVIPGMRMDLAEWRLVEDNWYSTGAMPRGNVRATRGNETIGVTVSDGPIAGWTQIDVAYRRSRT